LKISQTGYSGSLLRISVFMLEPVFKDYFPTAFAPEYKRGPKNAGALSRRKLYHLPSAF